MFNYLFSEKFNGKVDEGSSVEPQEVILDKQAREKEKELGISERKFKVALSKWILRSFTALLFGGLLLLLGRSFQMQVIENESYQALAQRNMTIMEPTPILRGVIYDQSGDQLVKNEIAFTLVVDKEEVTQETEDFLVENVDVQLSEKNEGEKLKMENVGHEVAVAVEAREDNLPGLEIERDLGRVYSYGPTLSHILGYTGQVSREELNENPGRYVIHDYTGKTGLEKYYEESLARNRKKLEVKRDSKGNVIEREKGGAEPGDNLKLWIDLELQQKTKEVLEEIAEEDDVSKASAIAMDPETGGVLSMVSIPSYDNNPFSRISDKNEVNRLMEEGEEGMFLNRTVEASYPVGSTIKPLLAAAALEEGVISPHEEIYSPGYLEIPNPWDPTSPTRMQDFQAHGWTDMREAIAVSSNVYFYQIGGGHKTQEGLGVDRIGDYLEKFGWGASTGVDLPYERSGRVPGPDWKKEELDRSWMLGDTYNLSIGQGFLKTTPLQVATAYSALINGGKVLEPRLVREIEGEKSERIETEIKNSEFISESNLEVVKEGMRKTTTMEEGTASRLGWLDVEVGAKTGTAQIPKDDHYHNWIALFAPYEDPDMVMVILFEEVEGMQNSGSRAAYEILNWKYNQE